MNISIEVKKLVLFLHGSGITAFGMEKWLKNVCSKPPPTIGVILPSAPMQRYDLDNQLRSVWHQRKDIDIDSDFEDLEGIDRMSIALHKIIEDLNILGLSDVSIGGFSMGGHLAIHSVYRNELKINKCFAISSYLINKSLVYNSDMKNKDVPLLLCHGNLDQVVPKEWSGICHKQLQKKNINSSLQIYKGLGHEIRSDVIKDVFQWIEM